MGKSINIVSVTKDTIDNVVSEFTKKVKEYYPKTDKFVNVHFESPFNVCDVIRLDPDKIAEEKWLWWSGRNKIASDLAFITDTKHALSLCFYISKLVLKTDENGICEALAYLSYIDHITQESIVQKQRFRCLSLLLFHWTLFLLILLIRQLMER